MTAIRTEAAADVGTFRQTFRLAFSVTANALVPVPESN
jgi:hypothetical protein